MRLFKRRAGLLANKKGNVLVMAAAAMPLIVGSAGLAIDTIQLSLMKRHLQRAADSGALAGAYARVQSKDVNAAVTKALGFSDAFPLASNPGIFQPTTGNFGGRSVRVVLTARRSLPFMSFFAAEPTITVEATAALVYSGKYCAKALKDDEGTGITFSGNSEVNLRCGVIANSLGSASVIADANSTVTASPVAGVGGTPSSDSYVQPTLLLPYSLKQPNPFANLPQPAPTTPCIPPAPVNGQLAAGCHSGLDVSGTLTLAPGTHYIVGGAFNVNGGANLIGDGVTLVFTSTTPSVASSYPTITINGNADLDLSAPTSGTYEGVLMHYDARNPGGNYHINGNSYSSLEGAFYFPTQNLTFNGNSEMDSNCIQLVAWTLTFEGNTEITNDCPADGGAKAFDASWVRLVA